MSSLINEIDLLKSKIRYLEDRNFILEVKNSVYEDLIKYQLRTMTWFQVLLKFLVDHQIPLITALCSDDIISIPNKIIILIENSIDNYEKHLDEDRRLLFNFSPYKPFTYKRNVKDLFVINQKLIKLNHASNVIIASNKASIYSNLLINDLKELFKRHNMSFNSEEFLKSVEASKIIFWLLRDVCSRIPFMMHDFDIDKISVALESIKEWIFKTFKEYTVNIFEKQSFAIEPRIYIEPIVNSFLNSLNDTFLFKEAIIELMNKKRFVIEKHSSLMERDVFNKFSHLMFKKKIKQNRIFDVPKIDFIFEKSDISSLLTFLNALFSLTDHKTEGEQLANNYLLQNLYLQKFLKSSVEQLGIDIENRNFINPINVLINHTR